MKLIFNCTFFSLSFSLTHTRTQSLSHYQSIYFFLSKVEVKGMAILADSVKGPVVIEQQNRLLVVTDVADKTSEGTLALLIRNFAVNMAELMVMSSADNNIGCTLLDLVVSKGTGVDTSTLGSFDAARDQAMYAPPLASRPIPTKVIYLYKFPFVIICLLYLIFS